MLLRMIFFTSLLGLTSLVFADEDPTKICQDMSIWRNDQELDRRTWAAYYTANQRELVSQGKKDKDVPARLQKAFESFDDSKDTAENLKRCENAFAGIFTKVGSRAKEFIKKANEAEAPIRGGSNIELDNIYGKSSGETFVEDVNLHNGVNEAGICNKNQLIVDTSCILSLAKLGVPASLEQYMTYEESVSRPIPTKYSPEDCDCRADNLVKENKSTVKIMESAPALRSNVVQVLAKEAGKKFINEFSAHLEDVQFYTNNKAWVVLSGKKENLQEYLCSDANRYKDRVEKECKLNGTEATMEARLAEVMGALGDNFYTPGGNLQSGFNALIEDINTYTEDVRNVVKDKPNILTRAQYDPFRYSLGRDQPQVNFVNFVTTMIIRDKDLKSELDEMISKGVTPMTGIMDIMSGKSDPEKIKKMLDKLARKHPFLGRKIRDISAKFGTKEYQIDLADTFHHALNLHPGLKNLLMNRDMFKDITPLVEKANVFSNMISVVENEKVKMRTLFSSRCDDVIKIFAQAVCTKEEDFLSKVSSKDLAIIMKQHPELTANQEAADLLICKMNENQKEEHSLFENMSVAGLHPFKASDYLDRKLNPNHQKNGMAKLLSSTNRDPKLAKQIADVTQAYNHERSTIGAIKETAASMNSNALKFIKPASESHSSSKGSNTAASNSVINSGESAAAAKVNNSGVSADPVSSAFTKQREIIAPVNQMNQMIPNFVNNFGAPQSVASQDRSEKGLNPVFSSAQEKLQQSLSGMGDKEQLARLISNITSSDAQNLLDMKERLVKNKESITDAQLAEERKKTKVLEDEYQEHVMKSEPTSPSHAVADNVSLRPAFSTGGPMGAEGMSNVPTSPVPSVSSSTLSAGGNFRDMASVQSAINAKAMDEGKIEPSLIIDSQKKVAKGKEDPSSDLINFLKLNETDGQTLLKLKESGIIYSYQIVDEHGKTVNMKKLVKYEDLSPEAKLLVDNKLAAANTLALRRAHSIQALRLQLLSTLQKSLQKI